MLTEEERKPEVSIHNILRLTLLSFEKVMAFILLIIGIYGLVLFVQSRTITISGKVISVDTQLPISDVMVAVESGTDFEERGLETLTKTDTDGMFYAKARGQTTIRIWKPGYEVAWKRCGYAIWHWGRDQTIDLREMTQTNWVEYHQTEQIFDINQGFSFSIGKAVDPSSPDADIVMFQDASEESVVYLESRGQGGLIFQGNDDVDLYNTPVAPDSGYTNRSRRHPGEDGIYFVRTHDGNHYAKVRLWRCGDKQFSYCLQWAYQNDGTRNLEVKPGKNFPFPAKRFEVDME
jgi:hypothetical protein